MTDVVYVVPGWVRDHYDFSDVRSVLCDGEIFSCFGSACLRMEDRVSGIRRCLVRGWCPIFELAIVNELGGERENGFLCRG